MVKKKEAEPEVAPAEVQKSITNTSIEDLPGVGPAMALKLREGGFGTVEAIAVASPGEIAALAEIGDQTASKITAAAKKAANIGGFQKGGVIFKKRQQVAKIKFGVESLDTLYGGGIETQAISEFYGEFGSGKTQAVQQLAVNVQLPEKYGGLHGSAVMIDTENTFRPERIIQMVDGLKNRTNLPIGDDVKLDPDEFLDRITVARAHNSNHQMLLVEAAGELCEQAKDSDYPVRLIIVDSLTAEFRSEYVGRGTLADRQQKLNKHMHDLLKVADMYNAAVVVTNQVQFDPTAMFRDPIKPIGGSIVGHTATFRTYIRKSKGDKRVFKLVDSPHLPDGEAIATISTDGIRE